jgi:hypothetical protein
MPTPRHIDAPMGEYSPVVWSAVLSRRPSSRCTQKGAQGNGGRCYSCPGPNGGTVAVTEIEQVIQQSREVSSSASLASPVFHGLAKNAPCGHRQPDWRVAGGIVDLLRRCRGGVFSDYHDRSVPRLHLRLANSLPRAPHCPIVPSPYKQPILSPIRAQFE